MKHCFRDMNMREEKLRLIDLANQVVEEYQAQDLRLTLRQLYYQFVSRNWIPNADKSYKRLGSIISDGRLAGLIDWNAIEDRGRVPDIPSQWSNVESLMTRALEAFRLPRWEGQAYYAELWVEKQALAGVLEPLAHEFHVPLMVNKGYCVTPGTRILTDDLRWVLAENVKAGDGLIGVDENVPGYRKHRRMRLTRVKSTTSFVSPRVRVVTNEGTIVVSTNHPFLATKYPRPEVNGYTWVEAAQLKPGCRIAFLAKPWEQDSSWEGGWLAGMYDGEGCLPRTTVTPVAFVYQNPGAVADKLRETLTARGWLSRERGQHSQRTQVREFGTHGVGNILALLGTLRPVRLLGEFQKQVVNGHYPAKSKVPATVQAVELLKKGTVIGIETDIGTLITEGFVSHNSSQSAMYEASQRFLSGMGHQERDGIIFYLGDHDPSGEDMVRDIRDRMAMFLGARRARYMSVRKLAITWEQIQEYDPPPNPAKLSDSRAAAYIERHGDSSWEVDALPPNVLAEVIREAFEDVIDQTAMDKVIADEDQQKERLRKAMKKMKEIE